MVSCKDIRSEAWVHKASGTMGFIDLVIVILVEMAESHPVQGADHVNVVLCLLGGA